MAVLVSVMAFKGGVGKTTLATCLGLGLSLTGRRVLLVDFDPQANLTEALLTKANIDEAYRWAELYDWSPSYEALLQGKNPIIYPIAGVNGLYIIPSHPKYMRWAAQRILDPPQDKIVLFRGSLGSIAERYNVDYVIVDLPPQMYGIVVPIASIISNYIITPIIKGSFSVESVEYLIDTFYNTARSYTKETPIFLGAILLKFGTNETGVIREMRKRAERRIIDAFDRLKKLGIVDSNIKYWTLFDSIIYYNRILTKLRNTPFGKEPYIVKHLLGKFGGHESLRSQKQLINDISSLANEFQART